MGSQSRNWCFTLNNYTAEEEEKLKGELPGVRYIVFQREHGHEKGTPHLQGYLELDRTQRLSFLKKINGRADWEIRRGNQQQAIDYCTKEDTRDPGTKPFERGERANAHGVRKDSCSVNVLDCVRRGELIEEVRQKRMRLSELSSFEMQDTGLMRALETVYKDLAGPYRPDLRVITIIGPTGVGKSWSVQNLFPEGVCKWINGNTGCWFSEVDKEVCLFDEFAGQIPIERFLKLIDKYPMQIEVKGGMRPCYWKTIFICSNVTPECWYNNFEDDQKTSTEMINRRREQLRALYRRLNVQALGVEPDHPERYIRIPDLQGRFFTKEQARKYLWDHLNALGFQQKDEPQEGEAAGIEPQTADTAPSDTAGMPPLGEADE